MLKYLARAAAGEARSAVRREVIAVALFVVAAIVAIIAIVFALLSVREWLSLAFGLNDAQADITVACGLAVIAIIIVVIGVYERKRRPETSALATTAILAAPVAAGALGRRFSVGTVVAAVAVVAGAYLGRQAGRR